MSDPLLRTIVHPTDLSADGAAAFALALKLALGARARLQVVHVDAAGAHPGWAEFPRVRETLARWGALGPHAGEAEVAGLGMTVKKWRLPGSDPLGALLEHVNAVSPDLVVMSTHARSGIERLLRGNVAEPLARRSHAPTLFVPRGVSPCVDPASGRPLLRRVLFPVETPHAPPPRAVLHLTAAVVQALGVAEPLGELLHVGEAPPRAPSGLAGWRWEVGTAAGPAVQRILEAAGGGPAQLIAMGSRGHDGLLDALLGSTVEQVLRDAPCPVLVVASRDG